MKNFSKTLPKLVMAAFLLSIFFMPSCKKELLTNKANPKKISLSPRGLSTFLGHTLTLTSPIVLTGLSNVTIIGDSINGGSAPCIWLHYCTNVHITKCKLMNSTGTGVSLDSCTNVLIDSCFISNVSSGVYAHKGSQIRVNYNQFYNMVGTSSSYGNFVQFNGVSGTYNRIAYNKCEDSPSSSTAGDGLSLYQCNGTSADPIYVGNNWIRGGGTSLLGFAGIVSGDVGGSYQNIDANILVNTGYEGIQQQGGSYITMQHNEIYSKTQSWSRVGLASANYSGTPAANNTIGHNTVNWMAGYPTTVRCDTLWKPGSGSNSNARPTDWDTNTVNAAIDSTILPTVIITWK